MVIIVIFDHSPYDTLDAVRRLRWRAGNIEVFHEQSQEGEDCHDSEEGQGAAGEQGQGLQARPGVV